MQQVTAEELSSFYKLARHQEGGFFRESYRARWLQYLAVCGVFVMTAAACGPAREHEAALAVYGPAAGWLKQTTQTGLLVYKPEKCCNGYTLFTHDPMGEVLFSPVYLVDMRGEVRHQWVPEIPAIHARLLPDGKLFYNTTGATRLGSMELYGLYELDARSNVAWHLAGNINHDFQVIDNDTFLIAEADEMDPVIKIVTRDNKVLWQWAAVDHIAELEKQAGIKISTASLDWAHNNTAVFLGRNLLEGKGRRFKAGNIMFSFCNLNTIGIIDYPSGKLVWAWGPGVVEKQHAPEMLANGNILLFDNGHSPSRVVEINPLSKRIVWEYPRGHAGELRSGSLSNAVRLPNGNTLICYGNPGRLVEVTMDGEVVWDYVSPFGKLSMGSGIYRAYRYSEDYARPLFSAPGSQI
ncbi:MAG: hypothetical protein A2285_01615 [Elusimicrobia bacterium RIFOXYA12_FULL_57_11]|nr:MAG: hypothetical protein A2285_01615 [Elusimicrobia bacterium RIFOXYA12_FULL_57_11]